MRALISRLFTQANRVVANDATNASSCCPASLTECHGLLGMDCAESRILHSTLWVYVPCDCGEK